MSEQTIIVDEPDMEPEDRVETTISDLFVQEWYKPLEMMRVVNSILRGLGAKDLPGPMFYTYCEKGYIKAEPGDGSRGNKFKISKEAAVEWTEKYLSKKFGA